MHHRCVRLTASHANAADHALSSAERLLASAAAHLRATVGEAAVDVAQIELYDLALAKAELVAARALTDRAGTTGAPFDRRIADTCVAEVLANLRHRLALRPSNFGLTIADLAIVDEAFVAQHLAASSLAELGREFAAHPDGPPHDLGDDKRIMRDTFRRFADQVVRPHAAAIHRDDMMIPDVIVDGLKALGCFGLCVPVRFGGSKPDDRDDSLGMVVATEELSRVSLGAAGSLITRPEIVARALLEGGTAAQQARWLPALAAGEPLCAVSVTEPGTGSDVASVALRAARVDGGWRLHGGKTWCTFAGKAGVILVLARTDPDARPPYRGLSLFLVEKPSTNERAFEFTSHGGTLSGRAIPTIGYRGMHSFEMFYDDVFVPDANVIGEQAGVGKGFYFTMRGFAGGRLQTTARATGIMQAAFESALGYARTRTVFDRPIAEFPLTLAKFARMGVYVAACRNLAYAVAQSMDRGDGQVEASLAKLLACRLAESVCREAMQIHGGLGYAEESDVSRYYVDARVLSIFEGAEETLALRVIGKALLETD